MESTNYAIKKTNTFPKSIIPFLPILFGNIPQTLLGIVYAYYSENDFNNLMIPFLEFYDVGLSYFSNKDFEKYVSRKLSSITNYDRLTIFTKKWSIISNLHEENIKHFFSQITKDRLLLFLAYPLPKYKRILEKCKDLNFVNTFLKNLIESLKQDIMFEEKRDKIIISKLWKNAYKLAHIKMKKNNTENENNPFCLYNRLKEYNNLHPKKRYKHFYKYLAPHGGCNYCDNTCGHPPCEYKIIIQNILDGKEIRDKISDACCMDILKKNIPMDEKFLVENFYPQASMTNNKKKLICYLIKILNILSSSHYQQCILQQVTENEEKKQTIENYITEHKKPQKKKLKTEKFKKSRIYKSKSLQDFCLK